MYKFTHAIAKLTANNVKILALSFYVTFGCNSVTTAMSKLFSRILIIKNIV